MSTSAFASLARAENQRASNIEEHSDYMRLYPRITQPRFLICGEAKFQRDGFKLFSAWLLTEEGWEAADVWARDADEARAFIHPFKGGKIVDVEDAP